MYYGVYSASRKAFLLNDFRTQGGKPLTLSDFGSDDKDVDLSVRPILRMDAKRLVPTDTIAEEEAHNGWISSIERRLAAIETGFFAS